MSFNPKEANSANFSSTEPSPMQESGKFLPENQFSSKIHLKCRKHISETSFRGWSGKFWTLGKLTGLAAEKLGTYGNAK